MMRTIIMCAALALSVTAARAVGEFDRVGEFDSANFILPGCKAVLTAQTDLTALTGRTDLTDLSFRAGMCQGVITTMADLVKGGGRAGAVTRLLFLPNFCPALPDGLTAEQITRVVVRYIDARPQRMHENFKGLTIEALHDAWPCKK